MLLTKTDYCSGKHCLLVVIRICVLHCKSKNKTPYSCRWGRWKWRTWQWRTVKISRHEIAGHEIARHDREVHTNSLFVCARFCSCLLWLVAATIQLYCYDHRCPSRKNDACELCSCVNFRRPLIAIIIQESAYVWRGKIDWVDLPLHPYITWFYSSVDRSLFHRFHAIARYLSCLAISCPEFSVNPCR